MAEKLTEAELMRVPKPKKYPGMEKLPEGGQKLVTALTEQTYAGTDRIALQTEAGFRTVSISEIIEYLNTQEGREWLEKGLTREWVERYIGYMTPEGEYVPRVTPVGYKYDPVTKEPTGEVDYGFPIGLGDRFALGALGYNISKWQAILKEGIERIPGEPLKEFRTRTGMFEPPISTPQPTTASTEGYRLPWYQYLQEKQVSPAQRSWMESMFPELVHRFETGFPAMKEPEEGETGWMAYLRQWDIEQEWGRQTPWQRGEQPWRYQQMIKTVGF